MSLRPASQPPRPLVGLGTLVRLAIALGLTALILWKSDPARVLEHVRTARPLPLLGAVLLVVVDRTLMAWRWLWLLVPFQPHEGGAAAEPGRRRQCARPARDRSSRE